MTMQGQLEIYSRNSMLWEREVAGLKKDLKATNALMEAHAAAHEAAAARLAARDAKVRNHSHQRVPAEAF